MYSKTKLKKKLPEPIEKYIILAYIAVLIFELSNFLCKTRTRTANRAWPRHNIGCVIVRVQRELLIFRSESLFH